MSHGLLIDFYDLALQGQGAVRKYVQYKPSNAASYVHALVMCKPVCVCSVYVSELAAGCSILALIRRLFPVHQSLNGAGNYTTILWDVIGDTCSLKPVFHIPSRHL